MRKDVCVNCAWKTTDLILSDARKPSRNGSLRCGRRSCWRQLLNTRIASCYGAISYIHNQEMDRKMMAPRFAVHARRKVRVSTRLLLRHDRRTAGRLLRPTNLASTSTFAHAIAITSSCSDNSPPSCLPHASGTKSLFEQEQGSSDRAPHAMAFEDILRANQHDRHCKSIMHVFARCKIVLRQDARTRIACGNFSAASLDT